MEGNVLFNNALTHFILYGRKEGIVLFNDALNTLVVISKNYGHNG